jgi:hypothetical protein
MWINMHVRSLYRDKIVDGAGMGLWADDRWRREGDDWAFVGDFLVPAQALVPNEKTIILDMVGQSSDDDGYWTVRMVVSPDSVGRIIQRNLRAEEKRRLDLPL